MNNINGKSTNSSVYKIIYQSEIALDGDRAAVLNHVHGILERSKSWNPNHDITGVLMVSERSFAQVLEGPPDEVQSLFGRIYCDKRHRNIKLMQADYFKERDFAAWSMAFVGSETEPELNMLLGVNDGDFALGNGARGVVDLLRWLLSERRELRSLC